MANKFWIVTISEDNLANATEHGLIGIPAKRYLLSPKKLQEPDNPLDYS